MTSFEETPIHFAIDATGQSSNESESDSEIPEFKLPVSNKYALILQEVGVITNRSKDETHSRNLCSDLKSSQLAQQKKYSLDETFKKKIAPEPGFKISEKVSTFLSRRQKKKIGMKEKEKTKGFTWFNMPAPEVTEELKNDMMVVQMRQALDPKHFYKRSAKKANSKYFEVGTYVESPVDFYSSRIPKKQRKKTLVEELVSDMEFRSYQKKKLSEIIQAQPKRFHHKKTKQKKSHDSKGKKKKQK